jgi:hypothetical protein
VCHESRFRDVIRVADGKAAIDWVAFDEARTQDRDLNRARYTTVSECS